MPNTYVKQSKDKRYRLVNLKAWNRENSWVDFVDERITCPSPFTILEIEREDGSIEVWDPGDAKEKVFYSITRGEIKLVFQGPSVSNGAPFLGHLFVTSPGRPGVRYAFPRANGDARGNRVEYIAKISESLSPSDISLEGDKYFNQAFILEAIN